MSGECPRELLSGIKENTCFIRVYIGSLTQKKINKVEILLRFISGSSNHKLYPVLKLFTLVLLSLLFVLFIHVI